MIQVLSLPVGRIKLILRAFWGTALPLSSEGFLGAYSGSLLSLGSIKRDLQNAAYERDRERKKENPPPEKVYRYHLYE